MNERDREMESILDIYRSAYPNDLLSTDVAHTYMVMHKTYLSSGKLSKIITTLEAKGLLECTTPFKERYRRYTIAVKKEQEDEGNEGASLFDRLDSLTDEEKKTARKVIRIIADGLLAFLQPEQEAPSEQPTADEPDLDDYSNIIGKEIVIVNITQLDDGTMLVAYYIDSKDDVSIIQTTSRPFNTAMRMVLNSGYDFTLNNAGIKAKVGEMGGDIYVEL